MWRKLFSIMSAVSAVLFGAAVVLWAQSYWTVDSIYVIQKLHLASLDSNAGTISAVCASVARGTAFREQAGWSGGLAHTFPFIDYRPTQPLSQADRFGFAARSIKVMLERGDTEPQFTIRIFTVPDWLVCAVLVLMPAAFAIRAIRQRRKIGCCTTCSYDLTGNVSGICPECGTVIAKDEQVS